MIFNDRTYYIGDFKNSKIHGYGEYRWNDGKYYKG